METVTLHQIEVVPPDIRRLRWWAKMAIISLKKGDSTARWIFRRELDACECQYGRAGVQAAINHALEGLFPKPPRDTKPRQRILMRVVK